MPAEPNATCPICGARVYFWKNQAGSKVWFDALGHPWPKHPCLDVAVATTQLIQTSTGLRRVTKSEVHEAQRSAEGPLPPTSVVTALAPPETAGCLPAAAAALAGFLVLCILNWWRLVALGESGAAATALATLVALALIGGCAKVLRRPTARGLGEAQAQWAANHPNGRRSATTR